MNMKSSPDNPVGESSSPYRDRIVSATFLKDLIDACMMECYFREHMAERALLFHDSVTETILSRSFPSDPQTGLSALLSLNAPSHTIRNQLLRLTADSPDLLAIIKQEG